jgi:hypothetical protein
MLGRIIDNKVVVCEGNIYFSNTVFQPANTLTSEQKELFGVYDIVDRYPDMLPDHQPFYDGVYEIQNNTIIRFWEQRPIPQEEKDALLAERIDELWKAADAYQHKYISGLAVGLLAMGVMQQKPKAMAVQQWASSIWDLYYQRKAALTYVSIVNTDFKDCGSMPYSIPELRAELNL